MLTENFLLASISIGYEISKHKISVKQKWANNFALFCEKAKIKHFLVVIKSYLDKNELTIEELLKKFVF